MLLSSRSFFPLHLPLQSLSRYIRTVLIRHALIPSQSYTTSSRSRWFPTHPFVRPWPAACSGLLNARGLGGAGCRWCQPRLFRSFPYHSVGIAAVFPHPPPHPPRSPAAKKHGFAVTKSLCIVKALVIVFELCHFVLSLFCKIRLSRAIVNIIALIRTRCRKECIPWTQWKP